MANQFVDSLIGIIAPVLSEYGKSQLVVVLDKLKEEKPTEYAVLLNALYPVLDVYLQGLTDKTETTIDDVFVSALMGAIEQSAAKHALTLNNLDQD